MKAFHELFKVRLMILVVGLALFLTANARAATTTWSLNGYNILLNGQTFFAQGMGYYPLPIGNTANTTPYGDYFYNFQGQDMVWKNIVERDVPKMRSTGVNVVRLYAMWTCAAADYTLDPLCTNKAFTIYHNKFLDMLYNNGQDPIYLLVGVYTENNWSDPTYQSQIENIYKQVATELKDHPAVMGFMIGNELNADFKNDPNFWAWVNKVGKMIKEIAPDKLTTVALIDDGFQSLDAINQIGPKENGTVMPYIDAWGINNYRGDSSSSGPNSGFTAGFWSGYQSRSSKPLLMTEWGVPASMHVPDEAYPSGIPQELPNNAEDQATFIKNHYKDMVQNSTINGGISSGGTLFMWADQWDKQECDACSPSTHDGTASGPTGNFPGNWWDEEWFGLHSVTKDPSRPWDQNWDVANNKPYPADTLTERAAYKTIARLFTVPDPELQTTIATNSAGRNATTDQISSESPAEISSDDQTGNFDNLVPSAAMTSGVPKIVSNLDLTSALEGGMDGITFPWQDADPLEATPSDIVQINYSLDPNRLEGTTADWYLAALVYPYKDAKSFTVYHFSPQGIWEIAGDQSLLLPKTPSYVGDLFQLDHFKAFEGNLDTGYYEFIFDLAVKRSDRRGYNHYIDGEAVNVIE